MLLEISLIILLSPSSAMYNNHHYPQQSHYAPQSHPQYYAASYPHYNVQGSSISANSYASAAAYGLGMGVDEMGAGALQPTGVDRTARMDRRRPKYTRSKLGCLTCRRKKVKVSWIFSRHWPVSLSRLRLHLKKFPCSLS